ncbi:MAG: CBS domain-containing protein, partial [bacterium]|nr:CBS domain-containing protein [bacterium]
MSEIYHQLISGRLESGATFHKPVQNLPEHVGMNNPALDVMTDFKVVTAYTIFPLESIDEAQQKMVHRGVRMLLVVDAKNTLLGLVTSTDLMGEKP